MRNKPLVRQDLLRPQIVAASDLDTNALLTRDIQLPLAGPLGASMQPGERVWLQFNPIEPGATARAPLMLQDAILIAGDPAEAAATVALPDRQLQDVLPYLSAYQVYLIKPAP